MNYSDCITLAISYFGENWYRNCTIKQHRATDGHLSWAVSTLAPHRGSIRSN